MASDELSRAIRGRVTERDVDANASLQSVSALEPHLEALHRDLVRGIEADRERARVVAHGEREARDRLAERARRRIGTEVQS